MPCEIAEQQRTTRERDEAVRTQMRLMPADTPGESGVECAGMCVPADGVGGDYYDFLPLGSGRLGIALGDVSGKGMYAGLLAAAVQARLQAITARGGDSPAEVMTELNRLTAGTIEGNRFATVFFAAFDAGSSTLTYANAGHPPAILLSAEGNVRMLDATGAVVGWSADAAFEQRSVALGPGDVLAVYSDGLSEATSPGGRRAGRGRPDRDPPPSRVAAGATDRRGGARRRRRVLRRSARRRRPHPRGGQGAPMTTAGAKIRAVLVDDEEPARERLRRLLAEVPDVEIVGEAGDGEGAMDEIARLTPDVVFLDIQMPGCTGMEVAASLPSPRPHIVFCTAFDQYAVDAFELSAVDYLLKPVNRARLAQALERVRGGTRSEGPSRRRCWPRRRRPGSSPGAARPSASSRDARSCASSRRTA